MLGMIVWLVVLFSGMAKIAGDYLAVHLEVIVDVLGISQNLAGVTIFAFGNGSSDLFSTLAAMNSNSGSLAINELFGAAAFITTVVLGLVVIVQPFTVGARAFVGDVVWFIIAVSCLTAFLADGKLVIAECLGIIGLYVAFVCFAVARPQPVQDSAEVITVPTGSDQTSLSPGQFTSADPEETTRLLSPDTVRLDESACENEDARGSTDNVAAVRASSDADLDSQTATEDASEGESQRIPREDAFESGTLRDFLHTIMLEMYPSILSLSEQSKGEQALTIVSLPLLIPAGLTIPSPTLQASEASLITGCAQSPSMLLGRVRRRWTFILQALIAPQFLSAVIWEQALDPNIRNAFVCATTALAGGVCVASYSLMAPYLSNPRHYTVQACMVSFLSFTSALAWIYLISNTAVTLLQTQSSIFNVPNAIFGAVIFAIGNSSNDLFASPVVARRGFPALGAAACFGGPMMNTLLGIGFGGLIQLLKQRANPRGGQEYYSFDISPTLLISAVSLLFGLVTTLIYAVFNSWLLDKRLGYILIGVWSVFTVGNIGLSLASTG